jgi:hypothetical protein
MAPALNDNDNEDNFHRKAGAKVHPHFFFFFSFSFADAFWQDHAPSRQRTTTSKYEDATQ